MSALGQKQTFHHYPNWGAEARLHRENAEIRMFGYTGADIHQYNPDVSKRLVLIGVPSLINDLVKAVLRFIDALKTDEILRKRVASRIDKVHAHFSLSGK